jgi:hypothetical protein
MGFDVVGFVVVGVKVGFVVVGFVVIGIFVVGFVVGACSERKSFPTMLPDISTLKISELKAELHYLYGIDITGLSEKQDLIPALKTAREALPRLLGTHRAPELPSHPQRTRVARRMILRKMYRRPTAAPSAARRRVAISV